MRHQICIMAPVMEPDTHQTNNHLLPLKELTQANENIAILRYNLQPG